MTRCSGSIFLTLLLALGAPAPAQAVLPDVRTWISGVGDDANPGTRTAPARTLAMANLLTAAGGEINVLDPGSFGMATITQAVTLDGGRNLAGITGGLIINAGPGDVVTLRNLDLNGMGATSTGISFLGGGRLVLEHCNLTGFTASAVEVAHSGSGQLVLRDVHIKGGAAGVKLSSAAGNFTASLDDVAVTGAVNGLQVATGTVQVSASVFAMNSGVAILAQGGTITVQQSLLIGNGAAAFQAEAGTIRISRNDIFDNATGFGAGGGNLISAGDNRSAGNGAGVTPTVAPVRQ